MSFTQEVKQELAQNVYEGNEERAVLSALVQMTYSVSISSRGTAIAVTTENGAVSRAIFRMMKDRYRVTIEPSIRRRMNLNKNLIYNLKIYGETMAILEDLGIVSNRGFLEKPLKKIVARDSWARKYLAGAFMADGSVNSPKTSSYHLEIKAINENHADFLIELCQRFYIPAKKIERRGKWIMYIKSGEKIADFLRCVEAQNALFSFEDERISRDLSNSVQRLTNVDVANEYKSMQAAKKQLEDIAILEKYNRLHLLDEKVRLAANLRKENPEATLKELAELSQERNGETVSKSGMKHRFVKIQQMADQERKDHGEE